MAWNTGSSSPGDELMTRSTSHVAVCCSRASARMAARRFPMRAAPRPDRLLGDSQATIRMAGPLAGSAAQCVHLPGHLGRADRQKFRTLGPATARPKKKPRHAVPGLSHSAKYCHLQCAQAHIKARGSAATSVCQSGDYCSGTATTAWRFVSSRC
jgi:hypothetical protein